MSARDRLLADLQQAGLSAQQAVDRVDALLDEHAHELAQRIRDEARRYSQGTEKVMRRAAAVIDPLSSHGNGWHDTGRDAPGEEPTE